MCAITQVVHPYCFLAKSWSVTAGGFSWDRGEQVFILLNILVCTFSDGLNKKIPPPRKYFVTNTRFFRLKYVIMHCHAICLRLYMYILPFLPVSSSLSSFSFCIYLSFPSLSIYLFLLYLYLLLLTYIFLLYLTLNSPFTFSFSFYIFLLPLPSLSTSSFSIFLLLLYLHLLSLQSAALLLCSVSHTDLLIPDPDPGFWWPKLKKLQIKFLKMFFYQNCNLLIPRPPKRMSKPQEKPSALKRGYPALHNMKFLNFFSIFVAHFCPPVSWFGSNDLIESGSNPDSILIRNTAPVSPICVFCFCGTLSVFPLMYCPALPLPLSHCYFFVVSLLCLSHLSPRPLTSLPSVSPNVVNVFCFPSSLPLLPQLPRQCLGPTCHLYS